MKTKLTLLVMGSSLVLATPALLAQKHQHQYPLPHPNREIPGRRLRMTGLWANDVSAARLKEKLQLTADQITDLKLIEDDFANTSQQYQAANQPRIDAAHESNRQARPVEGPGTNSGGRAASLQQVLGRSPPYREAAVKQIRPLLTRSNFEVLENPKETNGARSMPLKQMIRQRIES